VQITVDGRPVTGPLRGEGTPAQFARFVIVGGLSSAVYALLFLVLAGVGDLAAMVVGSVVSSVLANELHRRLTFRAGERVTWQAAQAEGGALVVAGMVLTGIALSAWDAAAGPGGPVTHLLVIAAVTGAIGLVRFAALRWLFRPAGPVLARA
jgi:putative flippase GtrA